MRLSSGAFADIGLNVTVGPELDADTARVRDAPVVPHRRPRQSAWPSTALRQQQRGKYLSTSHNVNSSWSRIPVSIFPPVSDILASTHSLSRPGPTST